MQLLISGLGGKKAKADDADAMLRGEELDQSRMRWALHVLPASRSCIALRCSCLHAPSSTDYRKTLL